MKPLIPLMMLAATLFGGVKSDPVVVTRDTRGSLLYHTLVENVFTLRWVRPEKASRATLTITGDRGYSARYVDLTTTEQVLELPALPAKADAEQIFAFTLTFDTGETETIRLGAVSGIQNGAVAQTCGCRTRDTRRWGRASQREIVPVPVGLDDFTLAAGEGTPQAFDPGLDGAAGWMRLPFGEKGTYTLAADLDGEVLSNVINFIPGGLALLLR